MLIIVESPTKAKKIQSILKVKTMSTVGHFKDLPDAQIGVDLTTYEPTFVYHEKKANLPKELRAAARGETVMLAGDPHEPSVHRTGGKDHHHVTRAVGWTSPGILQHRVDAARNRG